MARTPEGRRGSGWGRPAADRRLDAPAFHRNHRPIGDVLRRHLGAAAGHLVEIGSGTGQHAAALAPLVPALTWWPTDMAAEHLESIAAWRQVSGVDTLRPPVMLDAASADWGLGQPGRPPCEAIVAILAINVIHIAPWTVAQGLFAGAGRWLRPGGRLVLYGPFARNGVHTAPSNAAFDASLRQQNPDWGVRDLADIEALATAAGLRLGAVEEMPANNLTLVLEKAGQP